MILSDLSKLSGTVLLIVGALLTYHYANRAGGRIGHTGMMVVLRLTAFIMVCLGVGITWNGVKALRAEIGVPA